MHRLFQIIVFTTISIFIFSCKEDETSSTVGMDNSDTMTYSNITILLDLSDRITYPNQVFRDTTIIRNILSYFQQQVKDHGFIYSKDRIQILIAPQAGNRPITFNPNIAIEEIVKSNKIVRKVLPELGDQFMKEVKDLYSSNQKFSGADIWTFFKDNPTSYFIKDGYSEQSNDEIIYHKFKNEVIIITDGYLVFDDEIQTVRQKDNSCMQLNPLRNNKNWETQFANYKMQPIPNKNFGDLKVMLLEVNPKNIEKATNEIDIITRYWQDWFMNMNVDKRNIHIHQVSETIPLINGSLGNFIEG